MLVNLRLLFGLLWRPMTAAKQLRDRAPVAFAVFASWLMTFLYLVVVVNLSGYAEGGRWNDFDSSFPTLSGMLISAGMLAMRVVLFIAVVYTPFAILIANLFERRAGFILVIREEYARVVSCSLLSLAASLLVTLPVALLIGWQSARLGPDVILSYIVLLIVAPLPIFAALMTITVGTSFRIGWAAAAVTTLISFLSLLGVPLLIQAATFVCASPFLLLLLLFLLRDRIDDFIGATRSRQAFKQNLEAATLNPADASAHYQLGLIYQKRGEQDEAAVSFQRAVEIDPQEVDAHYQLGRIARQQGRLNEAIRYFEQVVQLDPAHSQNEIWRETGLVYYDAGQFQDAIEMFDKFLGKRPSDAEARYWRGMTLYQLGRESEAAQEMQNCVESVRTAPAYKYRFDRRWMNLAENFLRERR
ncbi:MAG TPA: tetratricopeptide repeat protein [Blastocatellia bacterium]|jgi:tetratricopeptide (TPR) repeat protein|nr:tetratricopeptide repeat protein [Blastocatellia bacterium]